MKALETQYTLPPNLATEVDEYRAGKIARLEGILSRLPGFEDHPWGDLAADDLALRYALTHHVFESVSRAAQAGDARRLADALRLRSDQAPLLPLDAGTGPVLLAHPDKALFTEDAALAEAPVALVNPEICQTAGEADRRIAQTALAAAAAAGFSETVTRNCKVLVLIAERVPTDTTIRSWTTTALPATVHLDYFAEARYVSRDVIHEAAHSQLNDLFNTLNITFPKDVHYFAPWLQAVRPVFGFLHGAWAFSHVALYSARLAEVDAPADVRALSWALFLKHAEQIEQAHDDIARAVEMVPHVQLAELLLRYRDDVLKRLAASQSVG